MATFIERVNEKSNYTKLITVLKECFEYGEILNQRQLIIKFREYYKIQDIGEATKIVEEEFERIVTNLALYAKVKKISNGQYVLCLNKIPKVQKQQEKENIIE